MVVATWGARPVSDVRGPPKRMLTDPGTYVGVVWLPKKLLVPVLRGF